MGLGLGLEKRRKEEKKHLLGLGRRAETGIETETQRDNNMLSRWIMGGRRKTLTLPWLHFNPTTVTF